MVKEPIAVTYTLLPPPLSALPAKYHAPLSLGLHSLSAGLIAQKIAELAGFGDYGEIAFLLGVTHDIHQKLVDDGLASLKSAKRYLKDKLDGLDYREYWRYIDDALENDACGKGRPVRGLPKEVSIACHMADMAQGKLEWLSLLYWLRDKAKKVSSDLTVRFYSVMIPQPFARAYVMLKVYYDHIASADHLALTSPWGLYVITYEDELPEILEASWDELRIDPIIDYEKIVEVERSGRPANIAGIKISGDEARNKLWSRFARMFYKLERLADKPLYPKLLADVEGLFVNIRFTDIEFVELRPEEAYTCGLCGLPHHRDYSLPLSMYGTKQGLKIAGVRVTPEKWNRFLPAHLKVKTWDSRGPWRHGIGMCPLCTLDAVAIRQLGLAEGRRAIGGFLALSLAKPVPVELLHILGEALRSRRSLGESLPRVGASGHGIVLDYSTATVTTIDVPEPRTENMFGGGELVWIGRLLSLGLYPLKYLPGLDTSAPDRMLTTIVAFQALDFPITDKRYSKLVPWIAKLVEVAGKLERSEGLAPLLDRPEHAPLHLLSLDKPLYDYLSSLLHRVGVGV